MREICYFHYLPKLYIGFDGYDKTCCAADRLPAHSYVINICFTPPPLPCT